MIFAIIAIKYAIKYVVKYVVKYAVKYAVNYAVKYVVKYAKFGLCRKIRRNMATFHSNIYSNLCSSENESMILGVFLVVKRVFYIEIFSPSK